MRRLGLYLTTLILTGMLLPALGGHRRYSYFLLLRLVVSLGAVLLTLIAHKQNATGWMWALLAILGLCNPLA